MRTERIAITYQLTFESAFHFGTGLRDGLVHRGGARDAAGFLDVPGSTLKGVLRDRCGQLARLFGLKTCALHTEDWGEISPDIGIVERIFGTRFHPGRMYFDDAQMIDDDRKLFEFKKNNETLKSKFRAWQTEKRTQVSLSRLTRTANQGMLYTSEYGIKGLRFEGQIVGVLTGFALAKDRPGTYSLLLLLTGLGTLDRIGGNKSTGAGQIECTVTQLAVGDQDVDSDVLLDQLENLEYYELESEEAAP